MNKLVSIEPADFVLKYESNLLDDSLIIDVREPEEWEYYHLEHSKLMPMNTIPSRITELSGDKTIYVICAHGVRSAMVCDYLLQHGLTDIVNVKGGMAAVAALRGFQYD
jgi:rhodanese-related sulfurtransferase